MLFTYSSVFVRIDHKSKKACKKSSACLQQSLESSFLLLRSFHGCVIYSSISNLCTRCLQNCMHSPRQSHHTTTDFAAQIMSRPWALCIPFSELIDLRDAFPASEILYARPNPDSLRRSPSFGDSTQRQPFSSRGKELWARSNIYFLVLKQKQNCKRWNRWAHYEM